MFAELDCFLNLRVDFEDLRSSLHEWNLDVVVDYDYSRQLGQKFEEYQFLKLTEVFDTAL